MGPSSAPLIACLVVGCLALLLYVVAFSTPYWITARWSTDTRNGGLWKFCINQTTCTYFFPQDNLSPLWRSTHAFACIALVIGTAGVALTMIYTYVRRLRTLMVLATVANSLTVVSMVITIALYVSLPNGTPRNYPIETSFSWSFGLLAAALILFLIHGALLISRLIVPDREMTLTHESKRQDEL